MEIKGVKNMSSIDMVKEVDKGGRFVLYTYCISIVVMTFKRPSAVYFLKSNESPVKHGWPFLLISTIFGWWGIPWGPVYTVQSIYKSFAGTDVTFEVVKSLTQTVEQQSKN